MPCRTAWRERQACLVMCNDTNLKDWVPWYFIQGTRSVNTCLDIKLACRLQTAQR